MKVAVIAFGTRGDVQPLAVLAYGLARSAPWCTEVALISHASHAHFAEPLLDAANTSSPDTPNSIAKGAAKFVPVNTPPVLWKGPPGSEDTEEKANRSQEDSCVEATRGAGLVIFNMFALEGYHIAEMMRVPGVACHPYLAASAMPVTFPGKMRRAYPLLFRCLNRTLYTIHADRPAGVGTPVHPLPEFARQCPPASSTNRSKPEAGASGRRDTTVGAEVRPETAWAHVEHWMWPLFTDRWGPFRERLGLCPYPLAGKEPAVAEKNALAGEGGEQNIQEIVIELGLPPVLYLFSRLVVDTSPFWPRGVQACGYLWPPSSVEAPGASGGGVAACEEGGREASPAPMSPRCRRDPGAALGKTKSGGGDKSGVTLVEAFFAAREDRPLYVGFGSMWGMCPPGYRLAFALRMILLGARQAGCRCLVALPVREGLGVEGGGGGPEGEVGERLRELDAAIAFVRGEFTASVGPDEFLVHRGPLAHDLLLPRCSMAIHHGGSGTTAAVLRAGIPHVICPQQLDQFFWAERVRYLSVGNVLERSLFVGQEPSPIAPPALLVSKAASAILSCLTPQVKLRAACLGVKIRAENGLNVALDALSFFIHNRRSSSPALPQSHQPDGVASTSGAAARPPPQKRLFPEAGLASAAYQQHQVDDAVEGQEDGPRHKGGCAATRKKSGEGDLALMEMPNGMKVWCGGSAEEETFFIYGEVFEDRTYARMGVRVQDGDTVWDVGANVGLASIFFELETDTPDSLRLYAFEPLPLNRVALTRNLSAHCPRAVILDYALGAKNENEAVATFYPRMPGNSTLRPLEKERLQGGRMKHTAPETSSVREYGEGDLHKRRSQGGLDFFDGAEEVPCSIRTLSWAMSNLMVDMIDLLKIDVEGAELDVLLGVRAEDWPRIKQVVVEVHPVGDRVMRAYELLRDHGFNVSTQALGLDGTPIAPIHDAHIASIAGLKSTSNPPPHSFDTNKPAPKAKNSPLNDTAREGDTSAAINGKHPDTEPGVDVGAIRGDGASGSVWWCGEGEREEHGAVLDGVVFMVYATRL